MMNFFKRGTAVVVALAPVLVVAQQTPTTPQPFIEQQRQQERERALREANERQIDERLPTPAAQPISRIPASDSPCFRIDRVVLVGEASESFQKIWGQMIISAIVVPSHFDNRHQRAVPKR